jgi:uncharacterized membrane protein
VYQLSVYIHVLSALVWVGGMLFLALVIVPVTRGMAPPERARLFEAVGRRFRTVGWVCIGLLIVTGVTNLAFRGVTWESVLSGQLWGTQFGQVLALKLLLILVMLVLSLAHDIYIGPAATRALIGGDKAAGQRLRRWTSLLGRVSALLALIVVALAVMLVRGVP